MEVALVPLVLTTEEDQEGVYLVAAAVAVVVVVVGEVILVVVGDADAVVLVDLLQVLLLLLLGDLAARGAALQRPNEDYCNQLYYSCPLLPWPPSYFELGDVLGWHKRFHPWHVAL